MNKVFVFVVKALLHAAVAVSSAAVVSAEVAAYSPNGARLMVVLFLMAGFFQSVLNGGKVLEDLSDGVQDFAYGVLSACFLPWVLGQSVSGVELLSVLTLFCLLVLTKGLYLVGRNMPYHGVPFFAVVFIFAAALLAVGRSIFVLIVLAVLLAGLWYVLRYETKENKKTQDTCA